ncbi:alpha carbonic anhydrase [Obelidium mucronatum]|nr:alpha carbonic anhydrase [Obelidium mucronatum]
MVSLANILLAVSSTLAAPAAEIQRGTGDNCLSDVIAARGLEQPHLERRASWSYEGESGVDHWGKFNTVCESGEYQSPINFHGEDFLIKQKPKLDWASLTKPFEFLNNGHTLQLQLKQSAPTLSSHQVNNLDYIVQQVHFHSPSEHHVDEKYYELEAHFVHASADGKLNVIGLFFEIGDENPWIKQFVDTIPSVDNSTTSIPSLDMTSVIKAIGDAEFFSYTGSLTTPPCTEGVLWVVARQPLSISQEQLDKLRKVMPFNSRTTQANKSGKSNTSQSPNTNHGANATTAAPVALATTTTVATAVAASTTISKKVDIMTSVGFTSVVTTNLLAFTAAILF